MGLFARPAYAETDVDEGNNNIFSHSDKYDPIEAIRRRREKADSEKAKGERKERKERKSSGIHIKDGDGLGSVKRRRITAEEGAGLLDSVGLSAPSRSDVREEDKAQHGQNSELTLSRAQRAVRREKTRTSPRKASGPIVIELGGSEDELETRLKPPVPSPKQAEPEDNESDPEFAELKKKARAIRLAKQEATQKSLTPDTKSPTPGQFRSDVDRNHYSTPPLPDPAVKFLVTSEIPNTKPLIVLRRLSQRLQEIREIWCKKHDLSPDFAKQVFLTYRVRRIYDSTTCKTLGLEVGVDGETIVMKGAKGTDGVDQVHIEAVTMEIFERMKREKAEERKSQGGLGVDDELGFGAAAEEHAVPEETSIRLFLKAKGHPQPFKLKVKPSSKIAKIIHGCRQHFNAQDAQSVSLVFDGERIDSDALVQDTEIEDEDTIDVHIV